MTFTLGVTLDKRILVVDDDPDIRQVLLDRLESYGYAVETAQNGREALEVLHGTHFDGVLLDIHMPEIDGDEVLKRAQQLYPTLPVIMVSASPSHIQAMKTRYQGAKGYLQKPIRRGELKEAVERWF
jgi:CheY-like chemotaxis protein